MIWHRSICASVTTTDIANSTKSQTKPADVEVHPIILCLCLSNPVHLVLARTQKDRDIQSSERKEAFRGCH